MFMFILSTYVQLLWNIKGVMGAEQRSLHMDPSSLYSQGIMQAKSGLSGAGKQLLWKFHKMILSCTCPFNYITIVHI